MERAGRVWNRSGILAALCLITACSGKDESGKSPTVAAVPRPRPVKIAPEAGEAHFFAPAVRTGKWYRAGAYRVRSLVPGASIAPTAILPAIAYRQDGDDFCGNDYPPPHTAEGKWVRSRGWRTGDEGTFRSLTFVNVLRRYHYDVQECGQIDAGIVLFDHGRPIASVHVGGADDGPQIEDFVQKQEGALRLKNHWAKPFGELFVKGRDIEIRPLPPADRICGGIMLTNVFGKPIGQARAILRKSGWKPVPQPPPARYRDVDGNLIVDNYTDEALYKRGFKERSDCNPMSFCAFHYKIRDTRIMLYTQAEEVVEYFVEGCPRPVRRRA